MALWLAVGATLGIYSILYKENPVYRLVEHIYIGAAAGYYTYIGWAQTLKPLWWDQITPGEWVWIFALIGGWMFYFIYSQRHVWISRIIFGALLGLGFRCGVQGVRRAERRPHRGVVQAALGRAAGRPSSATRCPW